jgi:hypothetical protein
MNGSGLPERIEHGHAEAPATLPFNSRKVGCKLFGQAAGGSGHAWQFCKSAPDHDRARTIRKSTPRDHPLLLLLRASIYSEQRH